MLLPTNVQQTKCRTIINQTLISEKENSNTNSLTNIAKTSFFSNPDYNKVYKNFDYKNSYDAWIYEGNEQNKIVGYKVFQSYPYDDVKFRIGDYIHWNFNHKELSTWILTSLDTQYLYNVAGKILLCNNSLKWKDSNNNINCYPCVIEDALTYTNFKWGNKGLVESGGDIVVIIQRNKYTSTLKVNDRFIFSGSAFKIKQKFDEINPYYLELYMKKVPELSGDDLIQNIAINENPISIDTDSNIVITPIVQEILEGSIQTFNVYTYLNNIKQNNGFTVQIMNVPSDNYELTIINENEFSIKNIKQYTTNSLTLQCTDNITHKILSMNIWLGGGW